MTSTKTKQLEDSYPVDIRIGFLAAITFFILVFLAVPRLEVKPYQLSKSIETIILDPGIPIDDIYEPPTHERPKIPVPTDNPNDVNAGTIIPTDFNDLALPTTHDVELKVIPFYKVEKKPRLIKSFPPKYPEKARQLGWEGICVIEAVVGKDGQVKSTRIIKSTGYDILDAAANIAAKKYLFTPGIQRDKPVQVLVSIPVQFKLQ